MHTKKYNHEVFQLSFNFLHPSHKDVQCNNFKVHETKLVHNLIYYTFLKNNLPHENFLYINDQLTSPYFLKYAYTIKPEFMNGTLRNYDTINNYYIFRPIEHPVRPLIVPTETLEPCENYHSYHIHGSVPVKPVKMYVEYLRSRFAPTEANEVIKAVRATISHINPQLVINALACLLGQNQDSMKELNDFKTIKNYPQQTKIV